MLFFKKYSVNNIMYCKKYAHRFKPKKLNGAEGESNSCLLPCKATVLPLNLSPPNTKHCFRKCKNFDFGRKVLFVSEYPKRECGSRVASNYQCVCKELSKKGTYNCLLPAIALTTKIFIMTVKFYFNFYVSVDMGKSSLTL